MIIFPVLQEDRFDEANCEIPSPVEPLHASTFKSHHPARFCFSFVLWQACSQNLCQTWGRGYPWWVPKTGWAMLREDAGGCQALLSFLPKDDF